MSYCRFLDADVYVFMSVGGWLECCGCWLADEEEGNAYTASTTQQMVEHLRRHEEIGHLVPPHVYDELWADDEENFGDSGKAADNLSS